jgi:hypothetical protein
MFQGQENGPSEEKSWTDPTVYIETYVSQETQSSLSIKFSDLRQRGEIGSDQSHRYPKTCTQPLDRPFDP